MIPPPPLAAAQMQDERVADALAWAGRVFFERGWEHEMWSGTDAQLLVLGDGRDARRLASTDPLSRGRSTADAGDSPGAEVPCLSGRDVADMLASQFADEAVASGRRPRPAGRPF